MVSFLYLSPSIHHSPTLSFLLIFTKCHVSIVLPGQHRSQPLGFCVALPNLSPTEVLVPWEEKSLTPKQAADWSGFSVLLLYSAQWDLLISTVVWVPSSGRKLWGFTTRYKYRCLFFKLFHFSNEKHRNKIEIVIKQTSRGFCVPGYWV